MLTITPPARPRSAEEIRVGAVTEQADGTWLASLSLPEWPDHAASLRVWAPTHRELEHQMATWRKAAVPLQELAAALVVNDDARAAAPLTQLAALAPRLRLWAIEAYQRWPQDTTAQTVLGLCCVALGRRKEAFFHLLRAGSRWQAESPRGLLLGAAAMQLLGDAASARAMLTALRRLVETARIANIVRHFTHHVVWTRPDLLRHVRGVVQVGANVGDEADCWAALGVRSLIAFEPVPEAFTRLCANLRRYAPAGSHWQPVQLAVADRCGQLEFWQGKETGNSSFFELHPDRSEFHRKNQHARRIVVPTTTLDTWFDEHPGMLADHNLMFLDVQGAEHLVIEGARRSLRSIDYVVMELSEAEIYTGTWTIARMDALMASCGFDKVAQEPNGFPEQVDALYMRRGAPRD